MAKLVGDLFSGFINVFSFSLGLKTKMAVALLAGFIHFFSSGRNTNTAVVLLTGITCELYESMIIPFNPETDEALHSDFINIYTFVDKTIMVIALLISIINDLFTIMADVRLRLLTLRSRIKDHRSTIIKSKEVDRLISLGAISIPQTVVDRPSVGWNDSSLTPKSSSTKPLPIKLDELNLDCLDEIDKHLDGSSSLALAQVNTQLHIALNNMNLSGLQPPYLMLSESSHSETSSFFRLDDNRIIALPLPAARGKRVWGSPHGLIVTMDPTLQLHLLNIFSQVQVPLPPLLPMIYYIRQLGMVTSAFLAQLDWFLIVHKCLVFKIFHTEFLVMIILRPENVLYFTKPTKILQWVLVSNPEKYVLRDVALFQCQFYALCDNGSIVKINFYESDLAATATHLVVSNTEHETAKRSYLVASPDHLYGVFLYDFEGGGRTTFVVNKLNFGSLKWEAVGSIEDYAFFVGSGNSLYLCPASRVNYRRNCIYFTYDDTEKMELMLSDGAYFDFGIYDLDTWRTDWRLVITEGVRSRHSRPTWIAHGNFRK